MPDFTAPARFGEERNTPSPTTSLSNPEALRSETLFHRCRGVATGARTIDCAMLFVRASRGPLAVRRRLVLTR